MSSHSVSELEHGHEPILISTAQDSGIELFTFEKQLDMPEVHSPNEGTLSKPFLLEKSDSGMDEESFRHSGNESEDSDDDAVIKRKKPSLKKRFFIDDDDEDDSTGKQLEGNKENEQDLDKITVLSNDNDGIEAGSKMDCDGEEETRLTVLSSGCKDSTEGLSGAVKNGDHPHGGVEESGPTTSCHSDDNSDEKDESDGDDDDDSHRSKADDDDGGDDDDDDEGFGESQVDPEILAKLKKLKGASKTPKEREKYKRKTKPSADQMLELYGQSQKLTRESRVNLPYHEPEVKSLDHFLARASKKRQEYGLLRRPNDIQKAQIIHEKLSISPPALPRVTRRRKSKIDENCSQNVAIPPVTPPADDGNGLLGTSDSGVSARDVPGSLSCPVVLSSDTASSQEPGPVVDKCTEGENEMLDLEVEQCQRSQGEAANTSKICEHDDGLSSGDISMSGSCAVSVCGVAGEKDSVEGIDGPFIFMSSPTLPEICPSISTTESQCIEKLEESSEKPSSPVTDSDCPYVPPLRKDPSRDLFRSQSSAGDVHEHRLDGGICDSGGVVAESSQRGESDFTSWTGETTQSNEHCGGQEDLENIKISLHPHETEVSCESVKIPQKRLLDKLQHFELPALPQLSGSPCEVICLEQLPDDSTPRNPGLQKLMERLSQHSKKRVSKPAHDVDISVVEKEGEEGERKELKLKSFTYHVPQEEAESPSDLPGTKLSRLKQQLVVGMREKRLQARERRQQLYALEHEEGFERAEEGEAEEEEEEEEMTDESDTDEEEDDPLQIGQMDIDDSDDGKDYNPLLDTEAKDSEDEENESDSDEDSNEIHLRFEDSDEEAEADNADDSDDDDDNNDYDGLQPIRAKKKGWSLLDDDDDDNDGPGGTSNNEEESDKVSRGKNDLTNGNETEDQKREEGILNESEGTFTSQNLWNNEMTPMTKHLQDSQTQDKVAYRLENSRSPDLYSTGCPDESESNSTRNFEQLNDSSQSLGYFNTQSQMLDADGYLKLTQTQKPRSKLPMLAQNDFSENSSLGSSLKLSAGNIFKVTESQGGEEDDIKELMGLCSGTFGHESVSEDAFPISQNRLDSTPSVEVQKKDINQDLDPFDILSDDDDHAKPMDKRKRIKPVLSDSEDEEDDACRQADTDVEEEDSRGSDQPVKFTGFKEKRKGFRKEFLDVEAELSGSECESDENLDLAEEDDILEEEEGDKEMAGVSEEYLRDQVGRVHMKQLQDADDREVMRLKEMYFQDGDLHSDGAGRMRNFRWKDIDDASQQDMFGNHSDNEQVEEEVDDIQWRKQRFEREKFLEEETDPATNQDNSQLFKLGQVFLKRSDSCTLPMKEPVLQKKEVIAEQGQKLKVQKKGSFLSRGKAALVKIAQVATATLVGNSTKNSRNFLFQSVENQDKEDENISVDPVQPQKRKAHSVDDAQQASKKPKITPVTSSKPQVKRQDSVFRLLNNK